MELHSHLLQLGEIVLGLTVLVFVGAALAGYLIVLPQDLLD